MVTVGQIYDTLNELAPIRYQMEFDNSGFLVGDRAAEVKTVIVALDITDDVIREAISAGAELIVSHHPLLFHPLRSVLAEDLTGRKVLALAKHGISAICMHTNLDIAYGGVNDALMQTLGAEINGLLEPADADDDGKPLGCGRIGFMKGIMSLDSFLSAFMSADCDIVTAESRFIKSPFAADPAPVCWSSPARQAAIPL